MFPSAAERSRLLSIAESLIPNLFEEIVEPVGILQTKEAPSSGLGWEAVTIPVSEPSQPCVKGDSIIFDFGNHFVGYLSFELVACSRVGERTLCRPDSPARLRIVFGEVLPDVCESFVPFTGWLSQAWLPEESLIIDHFPAIVDNTRRHAFRYVKVEVVDTSTRFALCLQNVKARTVSSVPVSSLSLTPSNSLCGELNISSADLELLQHIDTVSLRTLRNCMQTVYEDGPRRDKRLWIGDLRLQSLTNYSTFRDVNLAKRCYYLLAALPVDDDGRISACIFEKPTPVDGGDQIVDYSLLFSNCIHEYVKFSGDLQAGKDLYPMARKQIDFVVKNISEEGIYSPANKSWHFIDWCSSLDRTTAQHCVVIFSLRALASLETLLSLPSSEVATDAFGTLTLTALADRLVEKARLNFYDESTKLFLSGSKRQISWASNAWAILARVHRTQEEGAEIMKRVYNCKEAVKAVTPYLHHYLVAAFLEVGLKELAINHIKSYWGSMLSVGADTFFEAWDPEQPRFAIYDDFHLQSFCHAWSSTPSLLLRQIGF